MRHFFLLLFLPLAGCSVDPLELEGKACPCNDGYVCVDGACRKQASLPGDAGTTEVGSDGEADSETGSDVGGGCSAPSAPDVPKIAAGRRHTCVIRDGALWCWGNNEYGQLGVGDQEQRSLPTRVGTESDWVTISASTGHTCGIRSSYTAGSLYCWGHNDLGQLGASVGEEVETSPALVSHNIQFRSVAAGESHTCGLDEEGRLWCWGRQAGGAVGLGNLGEPMTSPARLSEVDVYADLAAGSGHNCAVRDTGTLWCWGHYECYQVGSTTHKISPYQVDAQCWRGVAAGAQHTCALRDDDTLQCFGANEAGQLGMGMVGGEPNDQDCEAFDQPQGVVGDHHWRFVTGGTMHTCGITTEGALYCWGYNEQRQIANTDEIRIGSPAQLGTETNWVEVAAGFFHTCARNTDGEVYCRGLDEDGQQGTGSFNPELALVSF